MRSTKPPDGEADLTARARIRDAAVECFGKHGFDVTVRTIAVRARVSPGLVIHHFGSKTGLRQACDEHVRGIVRELKTESLTTHDSQTILQQLAAMEEYTPLIAYLFRSIQAGGEIATALHERMVTDVERYLALGEAEGTIRPSRDPAKRARWMAANSIGSILLLITLRQPPDGGDVDFEQVMREWSEEYMLPALEMYTEGLLTERTMLDAYLLYVGDPPEEAG